MLQQVFIIGLKDLIIYNRVNNEFYVCPVFNEAIKDNKKITISSIDRMCGLGTPEDLNEFLSNLNSVS